MEPELSLAGTSNTFNQGSMVPLTTFQWRFLVKFFAKKILCLIKKNLSVSSGNEHVMGFPGFSSLPGQRC